MKAVMGRCDLFVGCRMHSVIASTSMGVPTVAITYSQKAYGVVGDMLGLNGFILDIKNLSYERLVELLEKAWCRKNEIKVQLRQRAAILRNRALENAKLDDSQIFGLRFEKTKIDNLILEGKLEFYPSDMGLAVTTNKGEMTVEFDRERFRPAEVPILLCSTSKIRKLGFEIKHSLKDIINDQLNYFLDPER